MKLIAGLGNPGEKYENTRHNIGFMTVDHLACEYGAKFKKESIFEADVAQFFIQREKVYLVKPLTFMNNSGRAIIALLTYYNIDFHDFVVVYDDLNLNLGKLRLRLKGSAGGHNGIKSVIAHLKTQEFNRIKIGIGHPLHKTSIINHVLGKFPKEQQPLIEQAVNQAKVALDYFLTGHSFQEAMNKFN